MQKFSKKKYVREIINYDIIELIMQSSQNLNQGPSIRRIS